MTTVNGLTGLSSTFEKYSSSFFMRNPAALVGTSIPTIDECALWAVPNASFTYKSPYDVSYFLKSATSPADAFTFSPFISPFPSSAK